MIGTCPNCAVLIKLIEDQHRFLMAFHNAGRALAESELERARVEIDARRADAELARARCAALYAENSAKGVIVPTDAPAKFGAKGHKREAIAGSVGGGGGG